jgi:hypothetical protein
MEASRFTLLHFDLGDGTHCTHLIGRVGPGACSDAVLSVKVTATGGNRIPGLSSPQSRRCTDLAVPHTLGVHVQRSDRPSIHQVLPNETHEPLHS